MSYSLIGDTVNLASRIGELTKVFNCDILMSEETVKGSVNSFEMKKEETQMVRGYSRPITVYGVLE